MSEPPELAASPDNSEAAPTGLGERRPIASRNTGWAQQITMALAKLGISPNAISLASIIFSALAGVCLVLSSKFAGTTARMLLVGAAAGMQLRLLCNLFDGMVAVYTQRFSPRGELFNEVPDRVSDVLILVGAGYAIGSTPELGYLAAIVAVFVAYTRSMGKIVSNKQDFRGPMAKPQRMAITTVATLYVALTPSTWQPHFGQRSEYGVLSIALFTIIVGGLWTAWRRLSTAGAACEAQAATRGAVSPVNLSQDARLASKSVTDL